LEVVIVVVGGLENGSFFEQLLKKFYTQNARGRILFSFFVISMEMM